MIEHMKTSGVGCMVDSCGICQSCNHGEEQYCDNHAALWTYGTPDKTSPTGITQGGYANNIVVKEHFAIKIPDTIRLQDVRHPCFAQVSLAIHRWYVI